MSTSVERVQVPRVTKAWYILCASGELKRTPLRKFLWDVPIVLFRTASGTAAALLDGCPHRNVPLSQGRVLGDHLQCPYHGWEFSADGVCQHVPGLVSDAPSSTRNARAYAVREQQGFVWVYGEPGVEPEQGPFTFQKADQPGYLTVRHEVSAECSIHAIAENALDVPHTAFLHGGLFRSAKVRNRIQAVVERFHDRVCRQSTLVSLVLVDSPDGCWLPVVVL